MDKNLPIRKRLFLTATPRHYDIRKRDKEGDFAVASMDDEAIYGRVAHRLTFAQAAEQKIIVPYKVVISVVDSDMIDNALLDQSEVEIKGDPVRAKWVAHQIALKRAVEEHALKRIITFHSSINAAAAFASDESEGVGFHLPDFQRFHVSGVQPTAERDEHMRDFERVQRGVITNARCLTEGVDVPSVDMVAFMNPRRSRVDIVQAVGRAMRTAGPDKTCGYVLVPLFLEMRKGETLNEALDRSDFDEIAQVLNAMRENDGELSDIIQALMVDRGRTGGFDESRLRDKVEVLGRQIRLNELAASIRARLVEELGITWDERYGQLVAIKKTHGDCNVPRFWKDNPQLGSWLHVQRRSYKTGELSPDRIKRLEQLGFVWRPYDVAWEELFAELVAYKQLRGDCSPPRIWKDKHTLSNWVQHQRMDYKTGELSPDRIKRLEKLGFVWRPYDVAWEEKFAALNGYRQKHGDCNVPNQWKDSPKLAGWCNKQRMDYKKRKLPADKIERLERLGFVWAPYEADWEAMFAILTAYKQANGDCNVARRWTDNPELGVWCGTQRYAYKKNKQSTDRIKRLEQLGFEWNPLKDVWDESWEEKFAALTAYKQVHGHCSVPFRWKDDPNLEMWCNHQRGDYKNEKLSADRVKRLEQLGFVWHQFAAAWENKFAALSNYKQAHGDCNVPDRWKGNPKLASWVANQRQIYRSGNLSSDRIKRLKDIGFRLGTRESKKK